MLFPGWTKKKLAGRDYITVKSISIDLRKTKSDLYSTPTPGDYSPSEGGKEKKEKGEGSRSPTG